MRLLNVGSGGSKDVPEIYKGWNQDSLDIDPRVNPDIVCDARELRTLRPSKYDGVICFQNLEHFHRHEVPVVLKGFLHVLKPSGFAHIAVPDMSAVFEALASGRDINEIWYNSPGGPISFHDVIYGWGKMISQGNLYYCHKTGFLENSLAKTLSEAGFVKVMTASDGMNLLAFAFKSQPSGALLRKLEL